MELAELAYIGEIIAAVAVVASLIYVAQQLRQNTAAVQVGVTQGLSDFNRQVISDLVADREVAEFWVKAGTDFDGLDEVDQQRAIMFEFRVIQLWSYLFDLHEKGLLTEERWQEQAFVIRKTGQRVAVRESWKYFRDAYSGPFREFMAQYLE